MEYVEGRALRDVLDREAPLSLERSVQHRRPDRRGALCRTPPWHRPPRLKPENVLLNRRGEDKRDEYVKLLDFEHRPAQRVPGRPHHPRAG